MFRFFRKDMEKRCAYCASGVRISETEVACERRGIVDCAGHCRRFVYDPLRRVPPRPAGLKEEHDPKEFEL